MLHKFSNAFFEICIFTMTDRILRKYDAKRFIRKVKAVGENIAWIALKICTWFKKKSPGIPAEIVWAIPSEKVSKDSFKKPHAGLSHRKCFRCLSREVSGRFSRHLFRNNSEKSNRNLSIKRNPKKLLHGYLWKSSSDSYQKTFYSFYQNFSQKYFF